jgi:SWI/SNF-related matrix-associated actin-dependent regulator 1 of chromatin subfamily A
MRIEKDGDLFVAYIKFEERGPFKRGGWDWNAARRKWVTSSRLKASEFRAFAVGPAREELEAFHRGEGAVIAASMAIDNTDISIPAPEGRAYLPFQRAGIAYAVSAHLPTGDVLIADPPGLGKTIQAIGVINMARRKPRDVLIVCPASLKKNWEREFLRWDVHGLTVGIVQTKTVSKDILGPDGEPLRGPRKDGRTDLLGPKLKNTKTIDIFPTTDVVIINKEMFERHEKKLKGFDWDYVIVDEADVFCNPKAKTSQHIWGGGRGKARTHPIKAGKRIFLTGTPIHTAPINLWAFVRSLDPKGLGRDWHHFVERYCDATESFGGLDVTGSSNLRELNIKLRDSFMVRRNKKEVLTELPPKRREIVLLPDDGLLKQVEQEMSMARKMLAAFEEMMGIERDDLLFESLSRLYEGTDNMDYDDIVSSMSSQFQVSFEEFSAYRKALAIAKAPLVVEHVRRLVRAGEKVVLFCYHKEVAEFLRKSFNNCAFITGKTATHKRQDEVDRFQEDPDCMVFIGNISAAGVGFTLTASSTVVFAEMSWLPNEMEQAEDRTWRIGQINAVLVQHLVIDGSLDARMAEVLVERMDTITHALDPEHARRG